MKLAMVGSGYMGLLSGTCFAELGADVICIDKEKSRIESLEQGDIPIYEPGIAELIKKNIQEGRLRFSQNFHEHIAQSDLVFIAVGTPPTPEGDADISYVYEVAKEIAKHLRGYTVVITKSTVPVGSTRKIQRIISEINPDAVFDIASNPEFLREGEVLKDFMQPDRVVIGIESKTTEKIMAELYAPLRSAGVTILYTDLESAELIKYASNAFLATKISFINELANLCELVGADIQTVSVGMGLDKRIGKEYLRPGPGYGGSCLPKDSQALVKIAHQHGVSSRIVESAIAVNADQIARTIAKIKLVFAHNLHQKKITVLGLTFKAGTDDIRGSLALAILPALLEKGAELTVYDPQGMERAKPLLPGSIIYQDSLYQALEKADALIILTVWDIFKHLDLEKIRECMQGNKFIDLWNIYEPDEMKQLGFDYHCMGRPRLE